MILNLLAWFFQAYKCELISTLPRELKDRFTNLTSLNYSLLSKYSHDASTTLNRVRSHERAWNNSIAFKKLIRPWADENVDLLCRIALSTVSCPSLFLNQSKDQHSDHKLTFPLSSTRIPVYRNDPPKVDGPPGDSPRYVIVPQKRIQIVSLQFEEHSAYN